MNETIIEHNRASAHYLYLAQIGDFNSLDSLGNALFNTCSDDRFAFPFLRAEKIDLIRVSYETHQVEFISIEVTQ